MLKECGAKARTNSHQPCRQYALANGRCRFHGGKSTGAKTEEGKKKIIEANTKHGFYSAKEVNERRQFRTLIEMMNIKD